jgi:methane/ammonia monooxygenase subunit B
MRAARDIASLAKRLAAAILLGIIFLAFMPTQSHAHGERAQEPYLRTRTLQWYDVTWSADNLKVNDTITITGRFRLHEDWPDAVNEPEVVFVTNGTPGPVLVRLESYLNGVPARQSFRDLQIGRDYEYRMVMKARVAGNHHVHPMIAIKGSGPLMGPGKWIQIEGSMADFSMPVKTLTGVEIANLENWAVSRVVGWHLILVGVAAAWMLWWVRRPLLIPRYDALMRDREDLLITNTDLKVGAGLLVVVVLLTFGGYHMTQKAYPRTVPLQAGTMYTPPLAQEPAPVRIKFQRAEYDVPGRSMRVTMEVTNTGSKAVSLGEFSTANLRFVDRQLPAAKAGVDPHYPQDLIARNGLVLSSHQPIAPGETRVLSLEATDAAWEVERLTSFLTDVDSKFGALLFFFDADGRRHITTVGGPILPVFRS